MGLAKTIIRKKKYIYIVVVVLVVVVVVVLELVLLNERHGEIQAYIHKDCVSE